MVNPKKISEEGRALTCDEYDENLDILQNRANHVGTQSCTTISDLDVCLSTNSVIVSLQNDIDNNESRIQQIETDLSATGSFTLDLQNLETTLNVDIQQNRADIEAIEQQIALDIIPDINANTSNLSTLTQALNNSSNNLNPRLTALDDPVTGRMRLAEDDISDNASDINNIVTNLLPAETLARQNADDDLDDRIDQVIIDYGAEDTRLEDLINDEVQDRIQDVNTVDSKYQIITDDITSNLANEINDREDADTLLQAQINALNAGITSAIPTGTILAYAGTTPPSGFLFCRGQSVSRTTYAALFNIISTRYGSTNSTSFNVPDLADRICSGSSSTNLNSVATVTGDNFRPIPVVYHRHTTSNFQHTHDINIDHYHGLTMQGHTHPIGNLPAHSHSLFPYRTVALGGGNEDNTGGELTSIPSDDSNIYPNTANSATNIPGPPVGTGSARIWPPGAPANINRTDDMPSGTANMTTDSAGGQTAYTDYEGTQSNNFDLRQEAIQVNFIIKT